MILIKISNSRLKLFLRCPYAHYLKYYEDLERKTKAAALQRGSIVHEAIEAYNKGKSWKKVVNRFSEEFYKNTMAEERVELGDIPQIAKTICENYFACYGDEDLEYLNSEMHFELPLTKTITIEGYIDALVRDGNTLWPMEHKTYSRMPDRDFIIFNSQSGIYIWALEQLGYKPAGMLWNILLVKEPALPKLTSTGKLSQAMIKSTPHAIRKGIKSLGFNPKLYKNYINKFDYEDFFFRHKVRLSRNVVSTIMDDTIQIAKLIEKEGHKLTAKNLGKDCSWCSFKPLCQAELLGLDKEYIQKAEYETRTSRKEKEAKKVEKRKDKGKRHRK